MSDAPNFWEDPEVVARFAAREPDLRLQELIEGYEEPATTKVLDIGCAGGRNTVLLAEHGFDLYALDTSRAMVEETRRRVAEILGPEEAERRVRVGAMDELGEFEDESVDLVISIGVLHNAASWAEWERAVGEAARVLRGGGHLLIAQFSPQTDLTGEGVTPVPGERHLYEGMPGGRSVLLEPEELDRGVAEFGFEPEVETTVGRTVTDRGQRVSVNALYRKG